MLSKIHSVHQKLRQFSDHIIEEEMRIYQDEGISIPYRWHSILQILSESTIPLTVTQIAEILNKTHPDVVFTINQMTTDGLVSSGTSSTDKRKKSILLTPKAKELILRLTPLWHVCKQSTDAWMHDIAPDLELNIQALSQALEDQSLYHRIKQTRKKTDLRHASIFTDEDIKDAPLLLTSYWTEFKSKYFEVPAIEHVIFDLAGLKRKAEGKLFFVTWKNIISGAALLARKTFDTSEIYFFWIGEDFRRKYLGTYLFETIIDSAKHMGTKELMIHSHPKLVALNTLLKQQKFEPYTRQNQPVAFTPLEVTMFKKL